MEFTGWKQDVESVLAGLDLLLVPAAPVEAQPRVVLEAFAGGVPVMAFASGGIGEIIQHNATGFLVELRIPQALAAAMREVKWGPQRLCEGGAGAGESAARLYAGAVSGGDCWRQWRRRGGRSSGQT